MISVFRFWWNLRQNAATSYSLDSQLDLPRTILIIKLKFKVETKFFCVVSLCRWKRDSLVSCGCKRSTWACVLPLDRPTCTARTDTETAATPGSGSWNQERNYCEKTSIKYSTIWLLMQLQEDVLAEVINPDRRISRVIRLERDGGRCLHTSRHFHTQRSLWNKSWTELYTRYKLPLYPFWAWSDGPYERRSVVRRGCCLRVSDSSSWSRCWASTAELHSELCPPTSPPAHSPPCTSEGTECYWRQRNMAWWSLSWSVSNWTIEFVTRTGEGETVIGSKELNRHLTDLVLGVAFSVIADHNSIAGDRVKWKWTRPLCIINA